MLLHSSGSSMNEDKAGNRSCELTTENRWLPGTKTLPMGVIPDEIDTALLNRTH